MTIRGIPPDISYGLQCATETFDISSDVMTFYYRFNEDVSLADLVDNQDYNDRRDIKESLRGTARLYYRPYNQWFFTKAMPREQAWCVASAHEDYGRISAEAIDYHLTHFVSDALASGVNPTHRQYQEQWLDRQRSFKHCEKISAALIKKIKACHQDDIHAAINNPADFELLLRPVAYLESEATFRERTCTPDVPWQDCVNPPSLSNWEIKAAKKKRRKVLQRSSAFLRSLMGKDQTTLFIGGKQVRVEGERFIFAVNVTRIHEQNHGALDISVLEKSSGDYLCKLCWYVQKTPALDQMAAMIMAVQAGDEDNILRIGNAFSVQNETLAKYPHVHDLIKPTPIFADGGGFGLRLPEDEAERNIFDDRMLSLTEGTHAITRSNQGLHRDFHRRCRERMTRGCPESLKRHYIPHRPELIHHFLPNGNISREIRHCTPDELTLESLLLP